MSIMDGQNGPPEPGKTAPDADEIEFLKKMFRRLGIALSGLEDNQIEGLVNGLSQQAQLMRVFAAQQRGR